MACLVRTAQRNFLRSSSSPLNSIIHRFAINNHHHGSFVQSSESILPVLFRLRPYATDVAAKSPFVSNIIRIVTKEIEYQYDYAPPHKPAESFKNFTVEDHPGELYITMRGNFGDGENIKMEATMFDGSVDVPKVGDGSEGVDTQLHISMLVDISKGDGSDEIEFACSVWPDSIEVQKVYVLRRHENQSRPYIGPDFRTLKSEVQKELQEYLKARGVTDELSAFLHAYMANKDRIELIRWLANVKQSMET